MEMLHLRSKIISIIIIIIHLTFIESGFFVADD